MYLHGKKLEEIDFFRKLSVHGRKLGIHVLVFTPDDVDGDKVNALYYSMPARKWKRKLTAIPELVYDRSRYRGAQNLQKITKFRALHDKIRYLGRPLTDKWSMYQIMSGESDIAKHLPATVLYSGPEDLLRFLKQHQRIYLKPHKGTGGRGIVRLQRASDNVYFLQGRDRQRRIIPAQMIEEKEITEKLNGWNMEGQYIIQQGIPLALKNGRVHDFRMLVQKDGDGRWQITGCAGRVGPKKSVTSNLHGGGAAVPMDVLLTERFEDQSKVESIKEDAHTLGMKVAQFLEEHFGSLCELGIDLAIDPSGKVWLLEVNPKPSREVFSRIGEKSTYRTAVTRPLQYARYLFSRKTETEE
ncbi:YheC/YheD family protein [Paenibacillus xerothermodurans]|uniref:YheC/YheD family protein n=1 Tax=Paenibacillus xerothermodurans TaxID=1977292 RepID=A0A2W1P141_PAEXE|nr:YheC/YheD family protein [Paenibacillus xerothermodurans]PZE21452.1 YheC/YheD family protein [Paenibacillus xerothermodurans]